jgi:hypothetical protein
MKSCTSGLATRDVPPVGRWVIERDFMGIERKIHPAPLYIKADFIGINFGWSRACSTV